MNRTKRVAFVVAWSLTVITGAYALRTNPHLPRLLAAIAAQEPVHIVAHSILYGVLAAGCFSIVPRPIWAAPVMTMAIATVQEAAQTVAFGNPMGKPEAFDLMVDAVAMMVALALLHRRERRQSQGAS